MGFQSLDAWKERTDVRQFLILMRRRFGKNPNKPQTWNTEQNKAFRNKEKDGKQQFLLCFTQSTQKNHQLSPCSSTSPGILGWLDVIPQYLYHILFHLITKNPKNLFSAPPNVQKPNWPAEIFVLWFYAFGQWNNAENPWNCLNVHWSLCGTVVLLMGLDVYSWWSLNPLFKDSCKILCSSFPPFILPHLSN